MIYMVIIEKLQKIVLCDIEVLVTSIFFMLIMVYYYHIPWGDDIYIMIVEVVKKLL